jgi:hypothetical protein
VASLLHGVRFREEGVEKRGCADEQMCRCADADGQECRQQQRRAPELVRAQQGRCCRRPAETGGRSGQKAAGGEGCLLYTWKHGKRTALDGSPATMQRTGTWPPGYREREQGNRQVLQIEMIKQAVDLSVGREVQEVQSWEGRLPSGARAKSE